MTDKQAREAQLSQLAHNVRAAGERVIETKWDLAKARDGLSSAIKEGKGREFRIMAARVNALAQRLALLGAEYIRHQKSWRAAKRGPLA